VIRATGGLACTASAQEKVKGGSRCVARASLVPREAEIGFGRNLARPLQRTAV
jgi:hypothetical protein